MPEGASQPIELNVSDVDDVFLPSPSDLLVNLAACKGLVKQLLHGMPALYEVWRQFGAGNPLLLVGRGKLRFSFTPPSLGLFILTLLPHEASQK